MTRPKNGSMPNKRRTVLLILRLICCSSKNVVLENLVVEIRLYFRRLLHLPGLLKTKTKFIPWKAFTLTRILQIPRQQKVRLLSLYQIYLKANHASQCANLYLILAVPTVKHAIMWSMPAFKIIRHKAEIDSNRWTEKKPQEFSFLQMRFVKS